MGIDLYAKFIVTADVDPLFALPSQETLVALVNIIHSTAYTIDNLRAFWTFNQTAPTWLDDGAHYERGGDQSDSPTFMHWKAIQDNEAWALFDYHCHSGGSFCFGRYRDVLFPWLREQGFDEYGMTNDKQLCEELLTRWYDERTAKMVCQIIDGLYWA